ncbi:MAG: hypothetical protein KDC50_01885 [Flavobacterium sp.]|nr:hypothetical protein [Flavobacterium sp.]
MDICITVIVLMVGFNLKNWFGGFSTYEKSVLNKLFFYHFFIGITFHFFIVTNGGDATLYWEFPKLNDFNVIIDTIKSGSASGYIFLINYFPSKVINLSFFTGNMIYTLFGYMGFIYLFKIAKEQIPELDSLRSKRFFGIPIYPWIWFLPNLHFWSCGIGKDTILFLSISLFVFSIYNFRKRWLLLVISLIFSLTIRPHIILFLLVAFGIGYTFDVKLKLYKRVLIFLIFFAGFIAIFPYVLDFIKLENFEFNAIEQYTNNKAAKLNKAGAESGIDISGYPLSLKIFTFLFRPLFFDINGFLAVLSSFENLTLLSYTIFILFRKPFTAFKKANYIIKGMIIYFAIGSLAFSLILGNLGIMLRQKNQLFPLFIIFSLWTISCYIQRNKNYLK